MDDHDRGLAFDLATLGRRRMLTLLGGAGLALAGCSTTTTTTTSTAAGECAEKIPAETAGPYPGDGSNGPNVLTESGIVRGDIRSSFGSTTTTTAAGIPLTIDLVVTKDCAPLGKAAVYLWHCDIDGRYSMYSPGVTGENYLRGVQETDAAGKVRFTSVFPAAYSGRWPHIHFEVYPSLAEATKAGEPTATSQLALPEDVCDAVYATDGYTQSVRNLGRTSLESDIVFRDGHDTQLATVTGDVGSGYTATLTIGI
ncbi:dioxygenase family protein [Actinokineospora xionganensis]|uniref:3,4-dioxygenase subunit beta n=1 Tax=Actinokineospora xionganensis TaxID=2684470 RepID=A0ABR7L3M6_9PSEU|nr:3,4-dioxygenase subunit beta [Actinokineospora xionganensis]MBC6447034.1 3,4-dioxygenase subunit beta [Actinokineospora xionganensis]